VAITLVALVAGTPRLAAAQEPSAADKETARSLLIDGRAKRDAKDYPGALKSLKAAHAIMHVPTTGLDYAQVLEMTGQFVEARSVALEVTRIPAKDNESDAFRDARAAAAALADKLEPRIPSVVINVKGAPNGVEPQVTLDGAAVNVAALGLPRKVNPGTHVLVVAAPGFVRAEKRFILPEGGAPFPVEVALVPEAKAVVVPVTPQGKPPIPTWAWVAGGVGVVGLGVGIGFAVDYGSVKSKVSSDCPSNACNPSNFTAATALKSRWNRDVGVMGAGLGVGVVGLAAAVYGIVVRPGARPATTGELVPSSLPSRVPSLASVTPWLGPGTGGVAATGAF
jgi:hypothetical protein